MATNGSRSMTKTATSAAATAIASFFGVSHFIDLNTFKNPISNKNSLQNSTRYSLSSLAMMSGLASRAITISSTAC